MAATQIAAVAWAAGASTATRLGPYQDGSGNLWVMGMNSSTGVVVYKSTDGGATWPNSYSEGGTGGFLDSVFDAANGIIYFIMDWSSGQCAIVKFTCATATFARIDTSTGPIVQPDAESMEAAFLCRRSDGSFVVVYQGPVGGSMTTYRQAYYITCTSAGVWGTATLLYSLSGTSQVDVKGACLGASDRVHALMNDSVGSTMVHRSLSSANVLDTAGSTGIPSTLGGGKAAIFYNATYGFMVACGTTFGSASQVARATSQANPTWSAFSNIAGQSSSPQATTTKAFTYDSSGSKLYVFSTGMVTNVDTNVDVNSASSTTWGTSATQDTGSAPNEISAAPITGGFGVTWFDGTHLYFDTYSLGPVAQNLTPTAQAKASAIAGVAYPLLPLHLPKGSFNPDIIPTAWF